MKTICVIGLAAAVLTAGLLLVWKAHDSSVRNTAPVAPQLAAMPKQSEAQYQASREPPAPSLGAGTLAEPNQRAAEQSEWQTIESLLAQPHHRPLMREVPRLKQQSEARLVDLYHRLQGITNKQHIVRILAFGGDSAAAATLIKAVTDEYSGQAVSIEGHAILLYIPELLGVLARHNQEAFEFLLAGSRREFWSAIQLWRYEDGKDVNACSVVGACIKGLALSGRDEARDLIEWYRAHPDEVSVVRENGSIADQFDGAVVDAVFRIRTVLERGLESAMDKVFYDPEQSLREFRKWIGTSEGQGWYKWALGTQDAARARFRESGKNTVE